MGRVDFSTNAVVTKWYSGGEMPKYFRQENIKEFYNKINRGDTIRLALDYYALFPISGQFLSKQFIRKYYSRLLDGFVIRLKVFKRENQILFIEY